MDITKQVLSEAEIQRIGQELDQDGEVDGYDALRAAAKAEDFKTGYGAWDLWLRGLARFAVVEGRIELVPIYEDN